MTRIGFVGLGAMGRAIVERLLNAGYEVCGWNRSRRAYAALTEKGMKAAASLDELAESDVVISMLADDKAVRGVFADGGLLGSLRKGAIHINMATVSVELAREMANLHARREVHYVACPVLGRPDAALAGRLHLLVAGEKEVVGRMEPVLSAMGQKVWPFGERPEQANVVKIGANMTLACAIEAMGEGAQLMAGYGISRESYLEMLADTLFAAPAYKIYGALIAKEQFAPAGFRVELGLKDVKLALEAGESVRTPLPFAGIVRDNFLDCLAHGEGQLDWSALVKAGARRAGL